MSTNLLTSLVKNTTELGSVVYTSQENSRGGTTYTLLLNCNIPSTVNSFTPLTLNAHDIFNGNGKTIKNNTTTNGLFLINTAPTIQGVVDKTSKMPYIKNLKVESYVTNDLHGCIIRSGQKYFKVSKCTVDKTVKLTDPINFTTDCQGNGGICGSNCSNFIIKSCTVSSPSLSKYSGGIAGMNTGFEEGSKSIINKCTYTQTLANITDLTNSDGGCIVGAYSAKGYESTVEVYNCSSGYASTVTGQTPICYGGIMGSYTACGPNSSVKIRGCKSTFDIISEYGGICGKYTGCGDNSTTTINNCTSDGIIAYMAGGIVGSYTGCGWELTSGGSWLYNDDYDPKIIIFNCRSSGIIVGGGGIMGSYGGLSSCNILIKHCKSTGNISNNPISSVYYGGGGIAGPKTLINTDDMNLKNGKITIIRCQSNGNIGQYCGGVCGSYTASIDSLLTTPANPYLQYTTPPTLTISHCVLNSTVNVISHETAGYLLGSNSGYNTSYTGGLDINVYFNNITKPSDSIVTVDATLQLQGSITTTVLNVVGVISNATNISGDITSISIAPSDQVTETIPILQTNQG